MERLSRLDPWLQYPIVSSYTLRRRSRQLRQLILIFPIVNLSFAPCLHLLNSCTCYLIAVHGAPSYDVAGQVQPRLESNEVIHKVNNNHHQHPADSTNDDRDDEQTVYVIEFESESNEKEETMQNKGKDSTSRKQRYLPL